jgi:hypothetical protein
VPKTNQKYFENTEKIQTLQEEKNNITEQQNLSAEKLRKLEEDFEEEDRKFKSIYAETEGYRKVVEELEDSTKIENVFFENIEDLSYTEDTPPLTISDITQESKELMHSIQKYKELKLNLSRDIFLFQQNHILENIIPIDTRMDTDTAKGEEVMIQCRDGLVKVYSTLEENKRFLLDNIRGHNADIISGVGILLQMEKGIREFEKKINEELAHIQISNLPGVSFDIEVDKRLVKMIQTISNNNEDNPLDTKTLEILSNYIYQKTKQQNQIGIIDLIETVDYSILSTNKRTGEIEKIKDIQSNGTQTMINLIFVTILFNSSFKENRKLQLIIPLDEASNIDQFNVKTLITVMGERGCKIVAATPLATPEHLNIFDRSITIDQKQVKEMLSKNARYLVLINQNIFNIFYQNKFIEMED